MNFYHPTQSFLVSVYRVPAPCLEIYGKSSELEITLTMRGTMGLLINSNALSLNCGFVSKETLKPMSTAGNE